MMNLNLCKITTWCVLSFFVFSQPSFALPQGQEVVLGEASFDQVDESTLNITASDDAIIQYTSFNIAADETVNFLLPTHDSFSLNRILGGGTSEILGTLTSNGNLIFINADGFHFGASSLVNVGGIVASTHNLTNADFLAGNYIFGGMGNSSTSETSFISNEGEILTAEGGMAILIADSVDNSGVIEAPMGTIALASGDKVTVGLDAGGIVRVAVDEPTAREILDFEGNSITKQISNTGELTASGGKVSLRAESINQIFDIMTSNLGEVSAAGAVVGDDGVIEFFGAESLENRGTVDAGAGEVYLESQNGEIGGSVNAGTLTFKKSGEIASEYRLNEAQIHTTKSFDIQDGVILKGGSSQITNEGNWNNQGSFDGETSTINFENSLKDTRIYGDNIFHDFIVLESDKHLYFEEGMTQTVTGLMHIRGSKGRLVHMRGINPGTGQWNLDLQGEKDITYIHLGDSQLLSELYKARPSNSFGNNSGGWDLDPIWDGGGGDNNWSTGANWDSGVAPGTSDTVTFDNTSDKDSTIDSGWTGTVANFFINAGYDGTITQARDISVTSSFTQASGTILLSNGTFSSRGIALTGGTFDATTNSGTIQMIQGTGDFNLNSTLTINNLVVQKNTGSARVNLGDNDTLTVAGNLDLNNGLLNQSVIPATGSIALQGNLTQSSSSDGGTALIKINGTGDQSLNGSAGGLLTNIEIDKSGGTLTLSGTLRSNRDWTYTSGNVDATTNDSTFIFTGSTNQTVTGSHTLDNVQINKTVGSARTTIADNDTLTVAGTLTLTSGLLNQSAIPASGSVAAKGDVVVETGADGGTGLIVINGTSDQSFSGHATSPGDLTAIEIDKSSGTLALDGQFETRRSWTYTQGTLDVTTNDSTLIFSGNLSNSVRGSHTLDNVIVNKGVGATSVTIENGATLTVSGDLTLQNGSLNQSGSPAGGAIAAQGNVTVDAASDGGNASIAFTGGGDQTYTDNGGNEPNGDITINKSGGRVTLNSEAQWNSTGQDLTITQGELDLNGNNLSVDGQFEIGANGVLRLEGDETVATIDTNNGLVIYDGIGTYNGLAAGDVYNNLEFDSAGIWNLNNNLQVNGDLTQLVGTINQNSNMVTVLGQHLLPPVARRGDFGLTRNLLSRALRQLDSSKYGSDFLNVFFVPGLTLRQRFLREGVILKFEDLIIPQPGTLDMFFDFLKKERKKRS